VNSLGSLEEGLLALVALGIRNATIHGTDCSALFFFVEAHALAAQRGIDHEGRLSLGDGFVRAFGLANPAVDTLVRDHRCHSPTISKSFWGVKTLSKGMVGIKRSL